MRGLKWIQLDPDEIIAKSLGYKTSENTSLNATEIIQTLDDQNSLSFQNNSGIITSLNQDIQDDIFEEIYLEDLDFIETAGYIRAMLPESTRNIDCIPTDAQIDMFLNDVLYDKDSIFKPFSKPIVIPGGVVIRGDFKTTQNDTHVDAKIQALDSFVQQKAPLLVDSDENIQYFYIKDPTPYTEERFEAGDEMDAPVLLILGSDLSTNQNPILSYGVVSIIGLISVLCFSLESFFDFGDLEKSFQSINELVLNQDQINNFGLLLFGFGIIQIMHEFAHWIIAYRDKFQMKTPILIPSVQLGILGSITSFKTSPKNLKSLFDFALVGPLLGIITSILLLIIGLQLTLSTSSLNVIAAYPHIPIEFLRLSSFGSEIMEVFLGKDFLLIDRGSSGFQGSEDSIPLHPFALAGYIGIFINALNLLPIGSTDGGRISQALFGRSLSRLVQLGTLFILVIVGLFGYDEQDVFLYYAIYAYILQRETEIPCRNEVTDIDDFSRGFLVIFMALLVPLCLVPVM